MKLDEQKSVELKMWESHEHTEVQMTEWTRVQE